MHYVDRVPEPRALRDYRDRYTGRWVEYYQRGRGAKPSDSHWRQFQGKLEKAFFGLCAYCESSCRGEVDHFRPKSRFPQYVYGWSNWMFSCHDCNNSKGEKWPAGGYIDPCARKRSSWPEQFFDFDLKTGEITPKVGLSRRRWDKARTMIDDLALNAFHHLRKRFERISLPSEVLRGNIPDDPFHKKDFLRRVSARSAQFWFFRFEST